MRTAGNIGVVALLLLAALALEGSQVARTPPRQQSIRKKHMAAYSRKFADFRRSSFQPLTTQAVGRKTWFRPAEHGAAGDPPQNILVTASGLVVEYTRRLQKLDFSGTPLWRVPRAAAMEAVEDNDIVYYCGSPMSISAVDADGKAVLSDGFVHTASSNGWFPLVVPWAEKRLLVETFVRRDEEVPDSGPDRYNLVLVNPARWDDWAYHREFEGNALPGLLTARRDRVVIVDVGGQVNVLNAKDGTTAAQFRVEGDEFLQASLDEAGTLITVCRRARGEKVIAAYELQPPPSEKPVPPLWETPLPGGEDKAFAQPPATGLRNIVYYISANRLFCIEKAKILWESRVFPAQNYQYFTVLGDNSVLVAAANRLVHLNASGEEILAVTVGLQESITTPPVVDEEGRIYFGTPAGIYCYE